MSYILRGRIPPQPTHFHLENRKQKNVFKGSMSIFRGEKCVTCVGVTPTQFIVHSKELFCQSVSDNSSDNKTLKRGL